MINECYCNLAQVNTSRVQVNASTRCWSVVVMNVTQQKLVSEPFNKKAKKVKCYERSSLCGTSFFWLLAEALHATFNGFLSLCTNILHKYTRRKSTSTILEFTLP